MTKKIDKIYVACPYGKTSGGHESLHQLVSYLRNNNIDAYIYYFDITNKNKSIPKKFCKYNIEYVTSIIDKKDNILVISESTTNLIYKYKNVRKYIWFLSLDFYILNLKKNRIKSAIDRRNIKSPLSYIVKPLLYLYFSYKNKSFKELNFNKDKNINKYIFLYNCKYVRDFLRKEKIKQEKMFYLCAPISEEYFSKNNIDYMVNKEDIIVYNPKKGYEFTKIIIKEIEKIDKNIKCIPIKNMEPIQIKELLLKAKVYIDFGDFPGPERIPREAVSCYCNIVTSKYGSALNKEDVPICEKYKFNIDSESKENVVNMILDLIYNYEDNVMNFDIYRKKVINQKKCFYENIKEIFQI